MSELFDQHGYAPMLIGRSEEAFDSEDYLYEIKWDGTRCLAYCSDHTELINKRDKLLNDQFPELLNLHRCLPKSAVLDGEIVVFHDGKPDFYALQRREMLRSAFRVRLAQDSDPATFIVFDILEYNGKDLTGLPLVKRKEKLKSFRQSETAVCSRTYLQEGRQLYAWTQAQNLEGIVAKEKDSLYQCGRRTSSWIKIKNLKDEDFVICGYLQKERNVLSLVLGQYQGRTLVYKGHVTLGVSETLLRRKLPVTSQCPFPEEPQNHERAVWLKPKLVCTVKYMDKTAAGSLRQPVLKGLRDDKRAIECKVDENS
ncbi:non-homologous end-joining DNA ligase [Holdemania massiliensis]|uniref:non-homologous end-joining DNA ligase n=1 Tax=Holdemania massiliensis TaxID=1468449 RepID=UPI0026753B33|nr:non-homologous end-joining DNA ligase [Holdemania massiliensis]